ncbi:MAG TPA: amylo-alpha-1,6-glucosidase [Rhodocyclaceae bacterium]|nr:amylo-alpha-1,6-glucosidase [Rhodocyclaceae bacterium]
MAVDDAIQIQDRWYVLATSSRADDRIRVLKHDDTFGVFDRFGDIQSIGTGEQGVYHEGTRFLSHLELRINGLRPMLLNSNVRQDNSLLTVDLTTPDLYDGDELIVHKGSVHIFRAKLLWQAGSHEHLRLMNYGETPVSLRLSIQFAADYADIFEVRGFVRTQRGLALAPVSSPGHVTLGYQGLDGVVRNTVLHFLPTPTTVAGDGVEYLVTLAPKDQVELQMTALCEIGGEPRQAVEYQHALAAVDSAVPRARERSCRIVTSNEPFNYWIDRSAADLVMLNTDMPEGPYPYAGVPWYSVPFGRDGILTALMYLWVDSSMARAVLAFLARTQADALVPAQDAEPGKILHETRKGELVALGEIPFGRYYGSIDSTPLFVVLAGAYFQCTGDASFVRGLWPNVERALEWIDRYGDCDGDGFIEYRRRSSNGLIHQGWKDSEDSIFYRDGRHVEPPVALAEVQGYAYMARLHGAELALHLGFPERAAQLRQQAAELRDRFEQAFWSDELGTYAIALDGDKKQCQVYSSNAGQVLWSGIASPSRAQRVGERLLNEASFSGWGVRTIAEGESRYNPMSYHNGSIWPHDNALIAMGLARYGMKREALSIMEALFDASQFMDQHRLPELYCGFVRRPNEGPTLYPVACSPQAWASASVFYLLQACLGLTFDFNHRQVTFDHPQLPPFLRRVEVRRLGIGGGELDLSFERRENGVVVNVLRKSGDVGVSVLI